jgi:hypothetical protein
MNTDSGMTDHKRKIVFISKATPEDDEFVLWLAPRLEAAGYQVFADVLSLQGGDRWRKVVTNTLQNEAVKMLLCCRDSSLAKNGVQEEIGIAEDLAKELRDPRFIIPLRLERYKRIFGIGELQYVDFLGSWSKGLMSLLETLEKQNVVCEPEHCHINPNWEVYKRRQALKIEESPEQLTSNWLRISKLPDHIYYYQPSGAVNHPLMEQKCKEFQAPAIIYLRGFFTFASIGEVEKHFSDTGVFVLHSEHIVSEFIENGCSSPNIRPKEAKKHIIAMIRDSWEKHCRSQGFYEYAFSKQLAFHVTDTHIAIGKRKSWGKSENRRSSALRNIARGKLWQYGVSATPYLWPFPHIRIKARVLFSELSENRIGAVISDVAQQHRFRRSICSSWRNKAWHGRLMAFLEIFSNGSSYIDLPLSRSEFVQIESIPIEVTSPFTTFLPDIMPDDAEEQDASTLGNFELEDDD